MEEKLHNYTGKNMATGLLCAAAAVILATVAIFAGNAGDKVFYAFFAASAAAAGIFILSKRKNLNPKNIAFGLISIIILILFLEIFLHLVFAAKNALVTKTKTVDMRQNLSPYKGKDWARDYWEEYTKATVGNNRFEPFRMWKREAFQGKYVNINPQGVRKTWNSDTKDKKKTLKIYCFGGSTMWGTGARDDYTIPSQLSKILQEQGIKAEVTNFGETAYTFNQEIIYLTLLLKEGRKPDIVIFYDGFNDIYAAYQKGEAGSIQNYDILKEKFEGKQETPTAKTLKDYSMIRLAMEKAFPEKIEEKKNAFSEKGAGYNHEQLKNLADDINRDYGKSLQQLDKIAKIYDFKYICFLQPQIYNENKIIGDESNEIRLKDEKLRQIFTDTYAKMKSDHKKNFYDLSDTLENRAEAIYLDYCHLSEEGNKMVANKIFEALKNMAGQKKIEGNKNDKGNN